MMLRILLVGSVLAIVAAVEASADEAAVTLKQAPGHEAVEQNCGACHSLDYVRINSRFLSPKQWEAEVGKMINVFGAPIEPSDAKAIVDYLSKNYAGPG